MATLHEQIDEVLAADLHDQLSEAERQALHNHLVECADCRQTHKETQTMNRIIEETFAEAKPDIGFEQRMLARFRSRVPDRGPGVMRFLANAMRSRATQIAAVAALLLMLTQVGRMLTREKFAALPEAPRAATLASQNTNGNEQGFPLPPARPVSPTSAVAKGSAASDSMEVAQEEPIFREQSEEQARFSDARNKKERALKTGERVDSSPPAAKVGMTPPAPSKSEGVIVTGSNIPTAEEVGPTPVTDVSNANRKLIRNAQVELEVVSFDESVQKITAFAAEDRGYIATSNSQKQANGKLRGQVVVKVLPENLDRFLQKLRGLGELKNQTLGTDDVTKAYFDADARLRNARVMEQRLAEMLKKKSDDINDLLQVEKELGRVREQIEQMQGELKFMDAQVQFATVTITFAEKDMNVPAAFLLKERAQLALYSPEVEKIYNEIKALASVKVQITNAQLDRDNSGRVSARVSMLIAPEESDGVIGRVKGMGRVENYQVQTERVAQGGTGMSENAKTERDKVELHVSISRDEQEQALQETTLQIRTPAVDENARQLRAIAEKAAGRIRSSSFSRDPNGREIANVSLRVPMKNYAGLMQALGGLGKLENVTVMRQDRTGEHLDEASAPADVTVEVYSQGNIVTKESGIIATLRRTLAQGAAALMWSARMIGVALAFLAPWVIALALVVWVTRSVKRARARKRKETEV